MSISGPVKQKTSARAKLDAAGSSRFHAFTYLTKDCHINVVFKETGCCGCMFAEVQAGWPQEAHQDRGGGREVEVRFLNVIFSHCIWN